MNAFLDFVVRLFDDAIEMPLIFLELLMSTDPLTAVVWAVGTVFMMASIGIMGYFVVGALGIPLPHLNRGPGERIE